MCLLNIPKYILEDEEITGIKKQNRRMNCLEEN